MQRKAADLLAHFFCILAIVLTPLAHAGVVTQTQSFSFNHTGSVSSGLISLGGLYTNTEIATPSSLTFARFNTTLGRLTQATVTVTTSSATFSVHPSGVLALASSGTADRTLAYTVTAGTATGGDSAMVTTTGSALIALLGLGSAEIGGASLSKTTQFSAATDLAQLGAPGSVTVGLTATNTLSVFTVVSVLNGAGYAGAGTYAGSVSVTYTYTPWGLSGSVYNDADHDGFKGTGESGTGLTLYAKLVSESAPAGPALQAVTVDPATGQYVFGASFGTYRIVIDDNATLSDVTPLVAPTGWTATQASSFLRSGIVFSSDLGGQDFGLIHATSACGKVFKDDGLSAGTANDGIANGGETGIGGQTMQLLDAGNVVLGSVNTNADGTYCLYISFAVAGGASLRIRHVSDVALIATGASVGNSGGNYSRSAEVLTWTHAASKSYSGLNFGAVPVPSLTTNGMLAGAAGVDLWFVHKYRATSAGQVVFSLANTATPSGPNWTTALFRDVNDNGQIDAGEPVVSGAIAVTAGSTVALLVRVSIPGGAPIQAKLSVTLQADMTYANAAPSLHSLSTAFDVVQVLLANAEALQLTKTVDKISVVPGSTLIYTIVFTNTGLSALNNLIVADATPAYTSFVSTSMLFAPASLGSLTTITPVVGGAGALRWSFSGQLLPNSWGSVQFTVVVSP
jgi:uncharacterized repeat protein (TIGR01451 family)